jgi:hypothetical protein
MLRPCADAEAMAQASEAIAKAGKPSTASPAEALAKAGQLKKPPWEQEGQTIASPRD